jgi:hypothetical protein
MDNIPANFKGGGCIIELQRRPTDQASLSLRLNLTINAEVSSDSAHSTLSRHGGTQHLASFCDNIRSLPYHCDYWATGHVLDEASEEALDFRSA